MGRGDNIAPRFLELLFEVCAHNAIIYFHNLKFDVSYLFPFLQDESEYICTWLISGKEKRIRFVKIKSKKHKKTIELRDSAPLFAPSTIPLAEVLKSWCADYTEKLDMDYGEFEREGKISPKTLKYFETDVCGLGEALRNRLAIETDTTSLTTSSQCKKIVEREINNAMPTTSKVSSFKRVYPSLSFDMDYRLRPFYQGGFVYLNPKFADRILENVSVYDINSSYPSIMRDEMLPFAMPVEFKGKPPEEGLFVVRVEFEYLELKPGKIPFLTNRLFIGDYGQKVYASIVAANERAERRTFYLTNMEYHKALESYETGKVICKGGFAFRGSRNLFKDYIEHFRTMKETTTGARRSFSKLALNSPSGRWGINPDMDTYLPYLDEKKIMRFEKVEVSIDELRQKHAFYLPTSIFITAYGRMKVINAAEKVGLERFIYTDTDSVHTLGSADECFELDKRKLGYWDNEENCQFAKYLRQKRYAHEVDGVLSFTCAGIPKKAIAETITSLEGFRLGVPIRTKRGRQYEGGVAIVEETITL